MIDSHFIFNQKIILASASQTRLHLLQQAGFLVTAMPAYIDETAIKQTIPKPQTGMGEAMAMRLAELKAEKISKQYPNDMVLAADQLLILPKTDGGEQWFDKPKNLDVAKHHLRTLSGKTHFLATALVMYQAGGAIWRVLEKPTLTCWNFSDAFIDDYLSRVGEGVLLSVGSYQLEGLGIRLFSNIDGDYFSILGVPLLPLLCQLRLMTEEAN